MEIVSARTSLLSNFEVFKLLREQQGEQETAGEDNRTIPDNKTLEPSIPLAQTEQAPAENQLRIQNETIAYLMTEPHPTLRQDETSVKALLQGLRSFDLTKAEKLMIVNLAPTTNVELYTVVEELEDRLHDRVLEVLDIVTASLSSQPIQVLQNEVTHDGKDPFTVDTEMAGDFTGDWTAEEQVYYDEEGYGGNDDLGEEMDED